MAELLVHWPSQPLVQREHRHREVLGNVLQYGVRHFGLVETILGLNNLLGRYTSLGKVDVALVLVHTDDHDDFVATHLRGPCKNN